MSSISVNNNSVVGGSGVTNAIANANNGNNNNNNNVQSLGSSTTTPTPNNNINGSNANINGSMSVSMSSNTTTATLAASISIAGASSLTISAPASVYAAVSTTTLATTVTSPTPNQQLSGTLSSSTPTPNAAPYHPFHNGGILMIMPNGPSSFPPSLRKLRHVKSILCRNLIPSINSIADLSLPNSYFTLHAPPPHRATKNKLRYGRNANVQQQQQQQGDENNSQNSNSNSNSQSSPMSMTPLEASSPIQSPVDDNNVVGEVFEIDELDDNSVSAFKVTDNAYDYNHSDNPNDNYDLADEFDNFRDGDDEELTTPFYISEVVQNSYNPVWNSFECYQPLPDEILECFNTFNICVWDQNHNDEPLFQSEIDLTQLEFISQEIKQFVNLIIPPNSIIFELKDGLYVTKETKIQMGSTKLNDYKFNPTTISDKRKTETLNQELLLKLLSLKLQNMKHRENSRQLAEDIESRLDNDVLYMERIKKIETLKNRVEQLKEECCNQLSLKEKEQEDIEDAKKKLIPRACALTNAGITFCSSFQSLLESKSVMDMDKQLLNSIKATLEKKKWHLLSQIRTIYPITNDGGKRTLMINTLPLPNSDFNGCDEELISTALGYVCHIVQLASRYLDIPLRYPMTPMASRSFIKDEISHHISSKFPLYSKGVERKIFDYAVFLLNKNLEQMLNSQGLTGFTLKETLPNLQILLGRSRNPLG